MGRVLNYLLFLIFHRCFTVAWGGFIFYCNSKITKIGKISKCLTADIEVLQLQCRKINLKNCKRSFLPESLIISYFKQRERRVERERYGEKDGERKRGRERQRGKKREGQKERKRQRQKNRERNVERERKVKCMLHYHELDSQQI